MSGAAGRVAVWRAEATSEAVAELERLRDEGAVIVAVRPEDAARSGTAKDVADIRRAGLPAGSFVIRTSGSTGRPRSIVLTTEAFEASAFASAARLDLGPDDVWWASLSPAHVGGLALIIRVRRLGSGLVLTGGFDARDFWELCAAGRITHASFVPTMLRRVLEVRRHAADTSSLRAVLVGGAAADPDLLRRAIDAGIPVATTWGMTETASQVVTATPAETAADPTHAGRPLDGVGVRSVADGRLEVRTATMSIGEVVDGRLRPLADADGWFATDDVGRVDADGFVRITGRVSDRIITGGVNVDPLEIERALRGLAWVEDVAVVGVPDPEWGELVLAAVVPRPGAPDDDEARMASLPPGLTGPRRPKRLVTLPRLPLNANGKVDRSAIREAFA